MKDGVFIRSFNSQDREAILGLLRVNTPKYFAPEEEKDLSFYLDNEIEYYYIIEFNGAMVGSGGFNFAGTQEDCKISWDILHPDYQRKSLGSFLLNYRMEKLKSLKALKTVTVRTSQHAYQFYEKAGFELIEKVEDFWAKGYDLYKMEYRINL